MARSEGSGTAWACPGEMQCYLNDGTLTPPGRLPRVRLATCGNHGARRWHWLALSNGDSPSTYASPAATVRVALDSGTMVESCSVLGRGGNPSAADCRKGVAGGPLAGPAHNPTFTSPHTTIGGWTITLVAQLH